MSGDPATQPPARPPRVVTLQSPLLLAWLSLLALGCPRDPAPPATGAAEAIDAAVARARPVDGVQWPAPPDNGSPVAAQWVRQVRDDGRMRAELRLFNFGDKETRLVSMELEYLDEREKTLKKLPWNSPATLSPQSHGRHVVGAFMGEETKRLRVVVQAVHFEDNTVWKAAR